MQYIIGVVILFLLAMSPAGHYIIAFMLAFS